MTSLNLWKKITTNQEFYSEQKYHSHTYFQKSKSEIIYLEQSCSKTNSKELFREKEGDPRGKHGNVGKYEKQWKGNMWVNINENIMST